MAVSKKIINYLEKNGYKYELIEHRTTFTAWDTSQTTQKHQKKVSPSEIAKALVVKADNTHFLSLIPANKMLDKKKLLKQINANRKKLKEKLFKKLDLAKEAWMKKNIPGKIGAVPPFRELLEYDIFIDNLLAKQKNIYVGSGEYEYSVKLPVKQYLKNEKPLRGSFGAKRT
ncbi:MAG: YbaK/EbsC family protein [Parcubacteria group bacterium]|jgi:prolyl-tRNA editing enzyme YbaK/EbsC (Cys-tRNA(Pro) deacylase)